jgi:hypothetical protein
MKYAIYSKGKAIAKFLNKGDRDLCLGVLQETYQDCEFEALDLE